MKQKTVDRRGTFILTISVMTAIALILVAFVGIFAYLRFTKIVKEISRETRPELHLITAKSLVNQISEAEINVKTYSITKDEEYLELFYKSVEEANVQLNQLRQMNDSGVDFTERKARIDSLEHLIVRKLNLLSELLYLQDAFRVQLALDKVVTKIENVATDVDDTTARKPVEQMENTENQGFFGWLFGKKKQNEIDEVLANSKSKNSLSKDRQIPLSQVNEEVEEVKKEERFIEISIKEKELSLILADREVSTLIRTLLSEMEVAESAYISDMAEQAEQSVSEANRQIAIFCLAIGIVLILMISVIANYLTQSYKYRKALRKAKFRAEELAKSKEKFLANMSHEIRTPMNAIAGFVEQLSKSKFNGAQREKLEIINKSIDHLKQIVDDILDISKLQAGKLKLVHKHFDLHQEVWNALNMFKVHAEHKNIELIIETKDHSDKIVFGDPFRLRQIIINLLGNALKFTQKGKIEVSYDFVSGKDALHKLQIEIKDTGIGIEQEKLKMIFEEFEQGESEISEKFGGTGLGLAITRMLVELQEGAIKIESQKGKGTRVSVEIPYLVSENEIRSQKIGDSSDLDILRKLNVLVVDDEPFNRMLAREILTRNQIKVLEADNGSDAIQLVRENNFDMILMDARMPDMDGMETARAIRELDDISKSNVPIITLTAAVTRSDMIKYRDSGIDKVVPKPFKEIELLCAMADTYKASENMAFKSE